LTLRLHAFSQRRSGVVGRQSDDHERPLVRAIRRIGGGAGESAGDSATLDAKLRPKAPNPGSARYTPPRRDQLDALPKTCVTAVAVLASPDAALPEGGVPTVSSAPPPAAIIRNFRRVDMVSVSSILCRLHRYQQARDRFGRR
jgi:hypothetical protein